MIGLLHLDLVCQRLISPGAATPVRPDEHLGDLALSPGYLDRYPGLLTSRYHGANTRLNEQFVRICLFSCCTARGAFAACWVRCKVAVEDRP